MPWTFWRLCKGGPNWAWYWSQSPLDPSWVPLVTVLPPARLVGPLGLPRTCSLKGKLHGSIPPLHYPPSLASVLFLWCCLFIYSASMALQTPLTQSPSELLALLVTHAAPPLSLWTPWSGSQPFPGFGDPLVLLSLLWPNSALPWTYGPSSSGLSLSLGSWTPYWALLSVCGLRGYQFSK